MADLFISYSREDRERAEQVAKGMQAAGFDVFWDPDIPPGQTWADYIEEKLANCAAVIVLWSQHSTKSQWVREEARMGRERGKLIPASFDNSQPPFGFGEVQAANLSDWRGQTSGHPHWERLVTAVRNAVNRHKGGAAALASAPFAPDAPAAPASPPAIQPMMAPPVAPPPPRPAPPPPVRPAPAPAASLPPGHPGAAAKGGIHPLVVVGGLAGLALVAFLIFGVMTGLGGGGGPNLAIGGGADPVTAAANDYQGQIQQRIEIQSQRLAGEGFQIQGQAYQSRLQQGANEQIPANIQPGGEFRIVGVCDNDCRNLQLALVNEGGQQIAQASGARPVMRIPAGTGGALTITATMAGCVQNPCFYAVALYGR